MKVYLTVSFGCGYAALCLCVSVSSCENMFSFFVFCLSFIVGHSVLDIGYSFFYPYGHCPMRNSDLLRGELSRTKTQRHKEKLAIGFLSVPQRLRARICSAFLYFAFPSSVGYFPPRGIPPCGTGYWIFVFTRKSRENPFTEHMIEIRLSGSRQYIRRDKQENRYRLPDRPAGNFSGKLILLQ